MLNKETCKFCGILTASDKVSKRYIETVRELNEGLTFPLRIKIIPDNDKLENYEILPNTSKKITKVLEALGVIVKNLPKEQKPNCKTVIYTVKLTKAQKEALAELKSLI